MSPAVRGKGRLQVNADADIVVFDLAAGAPDAADVATAARELGVLVVALGSRTIRAVTHLDVTRAQVAEAADLLVAAAEARVPA